MTLLDVLVLDDVFTSSFDTVLTVDLFVTSVTRAVLSETPVPVFVGA